MECKSTDVDGPSRRQTVVIVLVIAAFVVGKFFIQALSVFPLTQCQWAWAFLVSGSLLEYILVAVVVPLVSRPAR